MVNPSPDREDKAATPILPAHIEDTVRAIAGLHWEHHRKAKPVQRTVARMTSAIGRPRFVGLLTLAILSWISLNLILPALGRASLDPPPFAYLQDAAGILSLYITSLILITQRHDEQLAEHRAQLPGTRDRLRAEELQDHRPARGDEARPSPHQRPDRR